MAGVLIGTRDGLHRVDSTGSLLLGRRIDDLARGEAGWWVLADGSELWFAGDRGRPELVATAEGPRLHCLLAARGDLLVGTAEAHLYRLAAGSSELALDNGFESAPGRDAWFTPWGGPPDVRSMALDVAGTVYLNVHVGGILRFDPHEQAWRETLDIHADVHEVIAHPAQPDTALAATAHGLVVTTDGASTWSFRTDGLHASYCRAVAVTGSVVFLSASRSNRGEEAAVYRTELGGGELSRCTAGLPRWFSTNVDTGCLAATEDLVAIGDEAGTVFVSADEGESWEVAADGLPTITCLAISAG